MWFFRGDFVIYVFQTPLLAIAITTGINITGAQGVRKTCLVVYSCEEIELCPPRRGTHPPRGIDPPWVVGLNAQGLACASHPPLKGDESTLAGGWGVQGGQSLISLEYQIKPLLHHIWYSSNWIAARCWFYQELAFNLMKIRISHSNELSFSVVATAKSSRPQPLPSN